MFHRTVLDDGPRVISARLPGSRSVSIAAYVLAGSRLEQPAEAGVAHFMEHLTFKGTAGYPTSRAISEAVEGVGGSANAATDRESTVYWVRVPRREATTAMGVLGELIVRPRLEDEDIDVNDVETGIPALLTIVLMPLTYDITVGIGAGFISWVIIKIARGKAREIHPLMWVVAILFLVFFLQGWYLSIVNPPPPAA